MKIFKLHAMKFLILIFMIAPLSFARAGLLHFRPLSAQQVLNVLRAAKREDAIPQGRVITQGIAAMSGFAAGIATGIGVPLVFNIDLANVTGITAWLNGNSGASSSAATEMQTQEICFNSRAANEINDDNVAEDGDGDVLAENENESARSYQAFMKPKRLLTAREGRVLGNARSYYNYDVEQYNATPSGSIRQVDGTPTTTAGTATETVGSPTTSETTQATQPTTTNTETNTNTGTTADAGTGTGTDSETVTQTGTASAVNCIVIQKPKG